MGIVFRQSAKNSLVVMTGSILGALVLWLNMKYTSHQQLGFTRTITNYAVAFSQIMISGLSTTLIVYIHRFSFESVKRKLLITLCLIIPGIVGILFSIVYFLCRDVIFRNCMPEDLAFMKHYFYWLPVFTLFFLYMNILEYYLGSQLKVAVAAFMREVVLRIINILLILLFGFGVINFSFLLAGLILTYLIPISIFLYLSVKTKGFGITFNLNYFSKDEYKEMANFTWFHFLLSITILLMSYLDGY